MAMSQHLTPGDEDNPLFLLGRAAHVAVNRLAEVV
jgi:hypothetical protein